MPDYRRQECKRLLELLKKEIPDLSERILVGETAQIANEVLFLQVQIGFCDHLRLTLACYLSTIAPGQQKQRTFNGSQLD